MSKKLKIALPKGSLQDSTVELFRKAGYNVYVSSRGYRPACDDDDLELFLIRAQEIGRYVNDGFIDCGITGRDWIYENRADVEVLTDLQYSKATSKPTRWVLVVPENSPITCAEDLQGKRIATEGVGITERWLQEKGIEAHVEFSWGATEVKVPGTGGRHRGHHGNGKLHQGQQAPHRGHPDDLLSPVYREPGNHAGRVEKTEAGTPGHDAQGRSGSAPESGSENEPSCCFPERPGRGPSVSAPSHYFPFGGRRLAGRGNGH